MRGPPRSRLALLVALSGIRAWVGPGVGAAQEAGAGAAAEPGMVTARAACRAAHGAILREVARVHHRQANVGVQAAVALGGQVVFHDALGLADLEHAVPVTRETRFGIASVTKAFTGAALLLAAEEGRLGLDDPVRRWVPEFPEKEGGPITLRMLAGHLAGIRHYRDERTPEFYATHYEDVRDVLPLYAEDPLVAPPGTGYRYSSYGYNLLAAAVQAATGVRFQDWVADRILRPLGLERTRFDDVRFPVPDRSERYSYYHPTTYEESDEPWLVPRWDYSYNAAGGNLIATAEELVRFGQAFTGADPALLSERSLARLGGPVRIDETTSERGYGWSAGTDGAGRRFLRATGSNAGLQAALVVYPEEALSVAVLSNTWGIGSRSAEMVVDLPLRMAAACLDG